MVQAERSAAGHAQQGERFRSGDVVGDRYELIDCIGAGAMGAVFRAHDRLLDADVAVKLIRIDPERTDRERATRRLLLEARAIARISHPSIVRIFDFGCTDVVPFIVMEALEGESLAALLAREGRMDAECAVRRLLPIADAVAVAHRRGVVHRDIKPENVFLARDEFGRVQPKLVDFGVARLREGGAGLTRPGALMGTPDYMAPEQAQGEGDVDERADVWAFGVVLYELMTARRPFAARQPSYLGVLKAIVAQAPQPVTELGAGDDALWAILAKAFAKPREQRWSNLRSMGEALAAWLAARGVSEDAYGASLKATWLAEEPPRPSTHDYTGLDDAATLRRDLDASSEDTVPPPALAAHLLPRMPARGAKPATGTAQTGMRTLSKTLESASIARFTVLQIAIVTALVSALGSAGVTWLVMRDRAEAAYPTLPSP